MFPAFARFSSPVVVRALFGAILLAAGLTLAGCGTLGRFVEGDNDPHPGVERARNMPIQGLDIARYQGNIDFRAARQAGIHFVYIKATDGGDYLDPKFQENWQRAGEAGMARGAYHFIYWCRPAEEQAAWFAQNVPADPYALPPVLDLEWNHQSSCRTRPDRQEALSMVRTMLAAMEAHTGKVPVIYTDITFHRDVLQGEQFDNPFWLRSVAAEPHQRYQQRGFTFWQYTQTGIVPGVRGEVDRNAFYGTEEEWTTFLLTGCDPRLLERLGPQGRCGSIK